jgi:uncharacterized membrane-anchored protein
MRNPRFFSRVLPTTSILAVVLLTSGAEAKNTSPNQQNTQTKAGRSMSEEHPDAQPQSEQPSRLSASDETNPTLSALRSLDWKVSPQIGDLGNEASIGLSPGLTFLGASDTNRFLQLNENLPCIDKSCYTLATTSLQWFAIFSFDQAGYVRDDEQIDPDALLQVLKANNLEAIEERKRRGLRPLYLEGWYTPPHYDVVTKRLEWATKARGEDGGITVNYSIRLLGRDGVMSAVLVSSPQTLDEDLKAFKAALKYFKFKPGKTYAEYRQGDKVAEYGLTALIVGGAAAAAAKSGIGKGAMALGAGLVKGLALGALALIIGAFSYVKNLFTKNKQA